MGKIKGFLFAVRHREILMTDLGLFVNVVPVISTSAPISLVGVTEGFKFVGSAKSKIAVRLTCAVADIDKQRSKKSKIRFILFIKR